MAVRRGVSSQLLRICLGTIQERNRPVRTENGFTLIELMLVVAIIGILATLALASLVTFQAKSKQTEAKLNLGAIADCASSYYAEHDTYLTSFTSLGWSPNQTTRYSYWYDGQQASGTPTSPDLGVSYADPGTPATNTTFMAAAVGNVDRDTSSDQWTIDDTRTLINTQNDITTP